MKSTPKELEWKRALRYARAIVYGREYIRYTTRNQIRLLRLRK